jgi:hypothetical protein
MSQLTTHPSCLSQQLGTAPNKNSQRWFFILAQHFVHSPSQGMTTTNLVLPLLHVSRLFQRFITDHISPYLLEHLFHLPVSLV